MAIYGYVRVSTAEQAAGTSLEEQERKIRGVALIRGAGLERVFCEAGASGSLPLQHRPVGRELFDILKPGDTVIVAKLDRAFRNAADALAKSDLWRSSGINLVIADMGPDPVTGNGVAKMFFGMLALVAEFERDRILERTREGRRAKAVRGGHVGGTAPFGYRVVGAGKAATLIQVPEQQDALKTIAQYGKKTSLRGLANLIHARHGVRISHETIRRILAQTSDGRD
jgi:DNA invertase Pin-like site-specific DNA recombinase